MKKKFLLLLFIYLNFWENRIIPGHVNVIGRKVKAPRRGSNPVLKPLIRENIISSTIAFKQMVSNTGNHLVSLDIVLYGWLWDRKGLH